MTRIGFLSKSTSADLTAMVFSLCAMSAIADTYVLNSALSGRDDIDWTVASSYSGTYARDPEANDTVEIPAGMTAKVTAGSASWTLLNTFTRIVPKDGAVFEVAVPDTYEGMATLSVPVTEYGLDGAKNTGTLRKTGEGALELASYGKVKNGANICDYYLNIAVDGGDLHLYRNGTSSTEQFMFVDMAVAEGATLHTCYVGRTRVQNLSGIGKVTLDNTAAIQQLFLDGSGYSSFDGLMTCNMLRIDITAGRHDITCPSNTIYTICLGGSAICGFTRLGANNNVTSSLGTGNFNYGTSSGVIYLGDYIETSSKTFWIYNDSFIDAGAHGGLTLSGKLDNSGETANLRILTLAGSNENACVISGTIPGKANQQNVFYLRKTGTGTWRMAHNDTRGGLGVIDVEDGTLQFDTIAEKGYPCSLGYATNLFEKKVVEYKDGVAVDYAMVLGGNGTEGTLEYSGTQVGTCSTRPIAIRSKGRFKTTDVAYTLKKVYALGAGERTLTLESSADTGWGCLAAELSDGSSGGRLSVVKEGDGIWQLGETNTFTGFTFVRQGTLLINNPSRKYKWYRFVVKENAYSCDRYDTTYSVGQEASGDPKAISIYEKGYIQLSHLALYDANGNNLVFGFKQKTPITQFAFEGGDARVMEPGEVAIGRLGAYGSFTDPSQLLQNLFSMTGYPAAGRLATSNGGIKKNDPSTWVPIVVRLPDDAPAAVRLDFQCGRNRSGVGSYNGRNITAFRLDASADGVNWDEGIAENDAVDVPEILPKWDSDGKDTSASAVRKDLGMVLSASETDMPIVDSYAFSAIGAANGGVVRVVGLPYEISGLVVDASASAGTISNVVFAASGTLHVQNAEVVDGVPLDLPGDYSQLSGVENIGRWNLTLDGVAYSSRKVTVKDGRLSLTPKGLGITFR